MKKEVKKFYQKFGENMEDFQFMGYGDYLFNEFKKEAPELTANYCIPVTAVLLCSDENHNLDNYGSKFLSYCNSSNLDKLCEKHNISRFETISLKLYKKLMIEISNNFWVNDNILKIDWNKIIK